MIRAVPAMLVAAMLLAPAARAGEVLHAAFVCTPLYSRAHAARSAQGLVYDWDLDAVPHLVVER